MENVSKYRTELMGLSILWIMLYHSKIDIPDILMPLKFIKSIGYAGVDIFFLLSGLGLTFSISKDSSLKSFYWKRMTRIIPVFWVVLFLTAVINFTLKREFDLNTFALSLVGLDFWVLGKLNTWFIPSIIACYIFFPGLYLLAIKYGYRRILPAAILMAIVASILLVDTPAKHILIFTIRIPVFILGIYIGFMLLNKQNLVLNNLYLNAAVLFLSMALLGVLLLKTDASFRRLTGLWWYPTIVMAYPVAVIFGSILDRLKQISVHLIGLLKGFGLLSLEIYLIHTFIFSLANLLELKQFDINLFRVPEYVIYVVISFFLAKLLHYFMEKINWDLIYNDAFLWAAKNRTKYGG